MMARPKHLFAQCLFEMSCLSAYSPFKSKRISIQDFLLLLPQFPSIAFWYQFGRAHVKCLASTLDIGRFQRGCCPHSANSLNTLLNDTLATAQAKKLELMWQP
jgi:hypothetical protein